MTSCQVRARAYLRTVQRAVQAEFTGCRAVGAAGICQRVHGLEQPPRVTIGRSVRRPGIGCSCLSRLRPSRLVGGKRGRQAVAVGGGDFLNAAGQALPQVEAVADLDSVGGTAGDALPVGERAVAADHLDTGTFAEPSAQLFGVPSLPERQREAGRGGRPGGCRRYRRRARSRPPPAPGA